VRRRAGAEVACDKERRNKGACEKKSWKRKSMLLGELEQKEHVGRRAGTERAWWLESWSKSSMV
jgi:hypothetical protein